MRSRVGNARVAQRSRGQRHEPLGLGRGVRHIPPRHGKHPSVAELREKRPPSVARIQAILGKHEPSGRGRRPGVDQRGLDDIVFVAGMGDAHPRLLVNERHFGSRHRGVVRDELALEQIDKDAVELVAVDVRGFIGERRQQIPSSAHTDDGHVGDRPSDPIHRVLRSRFPPRLRERWPTIRFGRHVLHDRRGRLVDDDVASVGPSVDDLNAAVVVPAIDERLISAGGRKVEQIPAGGCVGNQGDQRDGGEQGACNPMQRPGRRRDQARRGRQERGHEQDRRPLDDSHQGDGSDAGAGGCDQVRRIERADPGLVARECRREKRARRNEPGEEDQRLQRHRCQRRRCARRGKRERDGQRREHRRRKHPAER